MATEQPLFGASISPVNIDTQSTQELLNKAKNVRVDTVDYGRAFGEATQVTAQAIKAKSSIDASQAKADYLGLVTSDDYLKTKPTQKAELLENWYKESESKSNFYKSAALAYSGDEYGRQYEKREIEELYAKYNQAFSDYLAWQDLPAITIEGVLTGKTNKQEGLNFKEYIDSYAEVDPRIEKPVMRRALIGGLYDTYNTKLLQATNTKELEDIISEFKEAKKPLENPMFLNTREKEGAAQVAALESSFKTTETLMRKRFKAEAVTAIELTKNIKDPDVRNNFQSHLPYSIFEEAYGMQSMQKYNDYMQKFYIHEEARQEAYNFDPTENVNWSGKHDVTKKAIQKELDETLISHLSLGNFEYAGPIIRTQGAADSTRLNATRETIRTSLVSPNGEETYREIMNLYSKDIAAFNTLFPDSEEKAVLLTVAPMMSVTGRTFQETYRDLQETRPDSQYTGPQSAYQKRQIQKYVADTDYPAQMRSEISMMYNFLRSKMVPHKTIMEAIDKYVEQEPYKINYPTEDPKTSNVMEFYLDSNKPTPESMNYEDNINGIFYSEDQYGNRTMVTDIEGLKKDATTRANIDAYNEEHWVKAGFETGLDYLTSKTGKLTYQLRTVKPETTRMMSADNIEYELFSEDAPWYEKITGTWSPAVGWYKSKKKKGDTK